MFITCQECNTTYRLDERVLKPTGSKVRCSQCRNKFVVVPVSVASAATAPVQMPSMAAPGAGKASSAAASAIAEEKALEGIDLAELDAILTGKNAPSDGPDTSVSAPNVEDDSVPGDFSSEVNELDIDFDSVLEDAETKSQESENRELDDIGDMDFEIDDESLSVEEDSEDMDLGAAIADAEAVIGDAPEQGGGEPSLEDDLASVLDGLEIDSEESSVNAETAEDGIEDDLNLDSLDLDLDEPAAEAPGGDEPELSFEDPDIDLADPPASSNASENKGRDNAQDELDLEFDLDMEDEPSEVEASAEDVELSLDDEFDLQLDEAPAAPASNKKNAGTAEDDLDLAGLDTLLGTGEESDQEDLDLNLDEDLELQLDEAPEKKAAAAKADASGEDELDLTGLDTLLGSGDEAGDGELDLNLDEDLDLEGDFELEMDGGSSKAKDEGAEDFDDELDLTGLDTLMEGGDEKGESVAADMEEPDLALDDLDLDLDLDAGKPQASKTADAVAEEEELEDLDFELDTEFEEKEAAVSKSEEDVTEISLESEGEIDLSDIEQMLGGDEKAVKPQTPAKAPDSELGLGGAGEIDLAELETAIDEAELTAVDEPDVQDEQELELDLSFDSPAAKVETADPAIESADVGNGEVAEEELDLELELESEESKAEGDTIDLDDAELDLSDLGDIVEEPETEDKSDTIHTGDIELEFQIEEDDAPAPAPSTTLSRTTAGGKKPAAPVDALALEQTMETLAVEESAPPQRKPFKPKKKSSKSLPVLLLLLLLIGGAAGVWYAVTQMGIEIPYVSDYLDPKPKDPTGTMALSTDEINSKFIENSQAGRLFVITGKVRNGYGMARQDIRMQGRLYTKGKVVAKTAYSYAGTVINDQDLASLPIAEIKQRLDAAPQPQEPGGMTRPGQNVPFMLVFSDLPPMDQLDEFAVEPVSSASAQ